MLNMSTQEKVKEEVLTLEDIQKNNDNKRRYIKEHYQQGIENAVNHFDSAHQYTHQTTK